MMPTQKKCTSRPSIWPIFAVVVLHQQEEAQKGLCTKRKVWMQDLYSLRYSSFHFTSTALHEQTWKLCFLYVFVSAFLVVGKSHVCGVHCGILPIIFKQTAKTIQSMIIYKITGCGILNNTGNYILNSNIIATASPCILIQGNNIELHGSGFVITDATGGTLVGIQLNGNGHHLHDIGLENFGVGVDIYP